MPCEEITLSTSKWDLDGIRSIIKGYKIIVPTEALPHRKEIEWSTKNSKMILGLHRLNISDRTQC
jgi:hypothetical protein